MAQRTQAERSMTAAGLTRLLGRLDADPERAGREYEELRHALVRFFDWRGGWPPEECADEVIDRLARRLEAETDVQDVRNYAHGIARLVLLERRRQPVTAQLDEVRDGALRHPSDSRDNRLYRCFDRCLLEIPADGRSLILTYYQGERHAKIANRRRLAAAQGLSENALRSRIQRLRDRLEACVLRCQREDE